MMNHLSQGNFFDSRSIPIYVDRYVHSEGVASHYHEFYELVYMESGFSLHITDGQTTILTSGDVFGIYPGCRHGYKNPVHAVIYNCLFTEDAISDELKNIRGADCLRAIFNNQRDTGWNRVHLQPGIRSEVSQLMQAMVKENHDKALGWEIKLKGHLLELLIILVREFIEQDKNSKNGKYFLTPEFYKSLSYIEENYMRPLRLEDIASTVGLSSDYFSKIFKSMTGLSPMEYVKIFKIAKACEILDCSNLSVSKIAEDIGFIDNNYFSRVFKQVVGDSPSHYRETIRQNCR
ncbi:AraC family transcriptional regulator [Mahella australiensis]|uniref:Transcriptional regulator, AraC family n=1 Tax=Mahella australiensis (strain DSM 15567 / CIP 107919 / 50-1 BON) TaxID=697281 RepID=F3ZW33_MAHA5|nr:AraC family transcriptional regulator [Mahella australiensis]AEE96413.1 transcriptional regulator, AraC family [Mahella australiensis 50-1 BON]